MAEKEHLLLSGIQHFAFCPRQWALIHIEQVWKDNSRTVEGHYIHERTDDPFLDESRKGIRTVRAMPLLSERLGLRGIADVVEFQRQDKALPGFHTSIPGKTGCWLPIPIEYKRGHPKPDDRDAVQLCAQALALEEMLNISVQYGYLYYGETRHRERVTFTTQLREHVFALAEAMHTCMRTGITPKAEKGMRCRNCSLLDICLPALTARPKPVHTYIERMLHEEVDK
jgi:CRISPR-associated exonuclease Cas4